MAVAKSAEQFARVGEIELAYESLGDPSDPAVLLIMGLGAQLIYWPERLCELLVARGHRVIRFDNRDSGRSTKLDWLGGPSSEGGEAPYGLEEMAADAVGLLDALEVDRAHIVGASLGGMIAQRVAIELPRPRALARLDHVDDRGSRRSGGRPRRRWRC